MQNLLIKTLYDYCKSCRGSADLQLRYWALGPLLLGKFEKNCLNSARPSRVGTLALQSASVPHRRRRHCAMVCWASWQGRLGSIGPCTVRWTAMPPPFSPTPRTPRVHARRAAQPTTRRRTRLMSPPPRAVLRPCRGPYRDSVILACKEAPPTASRSAIKPGWFRSRGYPCRHRPPLPHHVEPSPRLTAWAWGPHSRFSSTSRTSLCRALVSAVHTCWRWISVNLAMCLPLMLVLIYYSNHWN
jgi:hypothetical protein